MKWSRLSSLSAYARPEAHLTRQTSHGALVTLFGIFLGLLLSAHELSWWWGGKGTAKMAVDMNRRHDLGIKIDITFPAIPCAGLSVDVLDASGTAESDVNDAFRRKIHLHKERLGGDGQRLRGKDGGEYKTPVTQQQVAQEGGAVMTIDLGAAVQQMNDMEKEMQAHEGCRLWGDIQVRRVAGRLHFAVHQQSFLDVLPQMLTGHVLPRLTNMSHVVNKLAFGPEFPGQVNPLDGTIRMAKEGGKLFAYRYFVKVVPTDYFSRMGVMLETSQYSVGEYVQQIITGQGEEVGKARNPYVDISFDVSPIIMTINQSPASFLHFLVRMCAVVGGVVSVTRMLDKLVHSMVTSAGYVTFTPRTSAGGGSEYGTGASSMGSYSNRSSYASGYSAQSGGYAPPSTASAFNGSSYGAGLAMLPGSPSAQGVGGGLLRPHNSYPGMAGSYGTLPPGSVGSAPLPGAAGSGPAGHAPLAMAQSADYAQHAAARPVYGQGVLTQRPGGGAPASYPGQGGM